MLYKFQVIKRRMGTKGMVQWVRCLLSRHEDLSLDLQHPHEKLVMEVHSNPSTGETRDRRIMKLICSQPSLNGSRRDPDSNHKQETDWG